MAGGHAPDTTPFLFEVTGEEGVVTLEGGAARGLQSSRLRLLFNGAEQKVDEGEMAAMADTAADVAGTCAGLWDDILNGTAAAPGFDHAVRLTRLIGDLMASSRSGARTSSAGCPGRHQAAPPSGTAASQAGPGGRHLRICKGAGPAGPGAVTSRNAGMTLSCVRNPAPAQVVCLRTRIVARATLGGTA